MIPPTMMFSVERRRYYVHTVRNPPELNSFHSLRLLCIRSAERLFGGIQHGSNSEKLHRVVYGPGCIARHPENTCRAIHARPQWAVGWRRKQQWSWPGDEGSRKRDTLHAICGRPSEEGRRGAESEWVLCGARSFSGD